MGTAITAMSLVTTSSTAIAGVQAKRFGDDNCIIGTNKLHEKWQQYHYGAVMVAMTKEQQSKYQTNKPSKDAEINGD